MAVPRFGSPSYASRNVTTSDAQATQDQRRSVAEAFAHKAFDGAKRDNAPSFLLTVDPFAVIWASPAAAALFDASELSGLASILAQPGNDMARWAADLLRRLPPGPPRLERRRIAHRLSSQMLTLLCGRAEAADGRVALGVAVMGLRSNPAHGPWQDQEMAPERISVASEATPATVPLPPPIERLRFVWKTDVLGQILSVDTGPLVAAAAAVLPMPGHSLAETIRGFDPGGAGQLADLLARSQHPIDIELAWPASNGRAIVPVSLKATPWFDAGRAFAGFKGFGLVDLARLHPTAPEPLAGSPPVDTDRVQTEAVAADDVADQEAPRRRPDAEATPARPTWLNAKPFMVLANVVQLRPTSNLRPAAEADELETLEAQGGREAQDALLEPVASENENAIERGASSTNSMPLSSSEQEAFQEIGRTLQSGTVVELATELMAEPGFLPAGGPLGEMERNAAALVDTTAAGMLVLSGPKLLFANQAVLDFLGYTTQADAEIGIGAAVAQLALRVPDGADRTMDLPSQDGETVRLGFRIDPVVWSGNPARLWTLHQADAPDPDQPRPAPEPIAPTSKDERDLLDAAGEPLALLDGGGHLVTLNVAAQRLFGQRLSRLVGQDVDSLLMPESRSVAKAALAALGALASEWLPVELPLIAGGSRGLDMQLTRLGADRIAVSWRDRAVVRHSLAADKAPADRDPRTSPELLAKLSHQIRTPLNAIIGFTEVMMDERFGPLGNPRYKDYLKDVHASGAHVMSLVNDLLDLSRIESGRHDLDLGAVDINRIIAYGGVAGPS